MIKRIGKLRQKKGAVLFVVIAIMTLLIAMASTAYYTARGAHNTVVSNYNYSQLYMSAISVADMVSEAVINDAATNASTTNNYKPLKDAVAKLENEGESITAHSSNITTASASNENIIQQLATNGTSVINGVVDGVVVKIEIPTGGKTYLGYDPVVDMSGVKTNLHQYLYTYMFTTTAYYNGNSITVEDYLTTIRVKKSTGAPGTPGAPPTEGTPGTPGSSVVNFTTFFTATGQDIGAKGYVASDRVVLVNTDEITDDAYFENGYTFFNANDRPNRFKGGITSTGSIILNKMECDGIDKSDDNDWFIGKDLVLGDNRAKDLNLGAQNNLYVGRDLVLACNANITAGDVYVEGDIYIIGQVTINGNLHVTGNIYYEMPEGMIGEGTDQRPDPISSAYENNKDWQQTMDRINSNAIGNGWTVSGDINVNGNIVLPDGVTKAKINGKEVTAGVASSTENGIGKYNPSNTNVTITNRVIDKDSDTFVNEKSDPMSVTAAIAAKTGTKNEYPTYTGKQAAYDNKVTIDFTQLTEKRDAQNQPCGYEGSFTTEDGQTVTVNCDTADMRDLQISIPYNKDGVFLDIKGFEGTNGNTNLHYEIESGDTTMPVVLGSNTTEDGKPSFSWRGDDRTNGRTSSVAVQGDGNVIFEMANYETDDDGKPLENSDGSYKYTPYNPLKYKNTGTTTYVSVEKEVVGTAAQVEGYLNNGNFKDGTKTDFMLNPGTSVPKDDYQNRVMLVSNSRTTAVSANCQNTTFCGYIYAPNGRYYAGDNVNSNVSPVFGGMIVSTYDARKATFTYAEPKPSIINSMLGSLAGYKIGGTEATPGTPGNPGTPGTPATDPDNNPWSWAWNGDEGKNGTDWQFIGSNYLG